MKESTYVHPIASMGKRLMDILIALVGLLITLPLFPIIALAIRLDSPGPIIYQQMRIGYQKEYYIRLFMMKKFRTMRNDAEEGTGPVWAQKNDPRITKIGNFLRKTRLDELPQLWNVLVGDMSMVGPRPERPGMYNKLENNIPFYSERTFDVVPGITGLAQVNMGYDETLNDVRNKVAYDHAYALALSSPWEWLKMDIYVMFKTIVVMITGRGQ
ncbi:sugar transferase [Endozoicomonas elysicola]|uniref:Sugar transferase n=1 Tax=Endozoicomonas elysicola TaxID=305900 RepID=A0A081K9L2_9GAMM|nr:sugar transferase [Endozoicomonas elysicola]KEI70838.1 sugar transferase [Endozoicomonas elysicola]